MVVILVSIRLELCCYRFLLIVVSEASHIRSAHCVRQLALCNYCCSVTAHLLLLFYYRSSIKEQIEPDQS